MTKGISSSLRVVETHGDFKIEISPVYDLLLSLFAISSAATDSKPGWARSLKRKLQPSSRKTLRYFFETEEHLGLNALALAIRLPPPRTVEDFLHLLDKVDIEDFVHTLLGRLDPAMPLLPSLLHHLWEKEKLTEGERKAFKELQGRYSAETLSRLEAFHKHREELRKDFIILLSEYWTDFFSHEFERILPELEESAERLQEIARLSSMTEILSQIAGGLILPANLSGKQFTFAPSFYSTPFVFNQSSQREFLLIFPARSPRNQDEAAKGEIIRALRALADPTRMEIVRLLAQREMYALELARILSLAHPTVLHHMATLRVAGFVQTELRSGNNYYRLQSEKANEVFQQLNVLLTKRI
jgi:DNA-binding transcriptional ArsR family regulator